MFTVNGILQPTQGRGPRHFTLDPTGQWPLAENQNSDSIVVFAVDAKTGRLNPTEQTVPLGAPVCIEFVAANQARGDCGRPGWRAEDCAPYLLVGEGKGGCSSGYSIGRLAIS
jgi:hypothetical protein